MNIPPEPASFSDDEMEAAADTLKWQVASARAAVAKHSARLIDQLDLLTTDVPGDEPSETVSSQTA